MPVNPALLKQIETNNAVVRRAGGTPKPAVAQLDESVIPYYDPDTPLYADPSVMGWPPMLPLELALGHSSPRDICEAHRITQERWDRLRHDPHFMHACAEAIELLKKDGMSFKIKARMQAEAFLPTIWKLAHDGTVAANVRADLMQFMV